jgi:uncharacterized protein YecE (DUF72 family)
VRWGLELELGRGGYLRRGWCRRTHALAVCRLPSHTQRVDRQLVIRLGTQGWNYDAWVGPFYPSGTRPTDYLRHYARAFDTVEIDATFYAVPAAASVRGWRARVPDGFTFALKLPQEITHERRFRHSADILQEFCDRARELGHHLGPILIQCAPSFGPLERPALAEFLPLLDRSLQFAIEFRHRAWITDDILDLLRAHGVALALSDARWISRKALLQLAERPTADFAYLRWMGPDREITDYSHIQVDRGAELDAWARVLPDLVSRVRTAYGYVNNHFAGHSPSTVRSLHERLGLPVVPPESLGEQISLFG